MDPWEHPARIDAVQVLRVWLRHPLTLGHVLLLDELDCGIVTGKPLFVGTLALSVLVCSQKDERAARKAVGSRWCPLFFRLWGGWSGRLDPVAEAQRFLSWFEAQTQTPAVKAKEPVAGRRTAAPWHLGRLAIATGELGLSHDAACNMPLKRLNQLVAALLEVRGTIQFWSPEDEALLDRVAAESAAAMGGGS